MELPNEHLQRGSFNWIDAIMITLLASVFFVMFYFEIGGD